MPNDPRHALDPRHAAVGTAGGVVVAGMTPNLRDFWTALLIVLAFLFGQAAIEGRDETNYTQEQP